jgi:hypothetical protein
MKLIQLTKGLSTKVDDSDFEALAQFPWFAMRPRNVWYAARHSKMSDGRRTTIYMHRQLLELKSGQKGDHRDGDGLNNQRLNLRHATTSQNGANRSLTKRNASGFKGVCYSKKDGKWYAYIGVNHKRLNVGGFPSPQAAATAYQTAAKQHFGDFAHA